MLTEEEMNNIRVYSLFREFIRKNKPAELVVFDFDELLVAGHLSKIVINTLQGEHAREDVLAQYPDNSFETIVRLSTLAVYGLNEEEAIAKKEEIVKAIPWREGATDILRILYEDDRYIPLVLSCGRYRSIKIKLAQAGLENIPVIGTEIMYRDGTAKARYTITDKLKGGAMELFKSHFKKTSAIGHGNGDILMLQAADVGIALREKPRNTDVEKIADHTVDTLTEAYLVLKLEE